MPKQPPPRPGILEVMRLGRRPYGEVYELQKDLLDRRIADEIRDTLVLVEHDPPVITIGRGAAREDARGVSIPLFEIERGGDATWHGPGQVVAYPIYQLPDGRRDVHRYLRDLEQVVIGVLSELGVVAGRRAGLTGVWIGDKKVASIGVAVRRWVTWHGLALNVHNDLGAFRAFRPCGLDPDVMTRVADHAEIPPANILFEVLIVKHFLEIFGLELPQSGSSGSSELDERGFPRLPILPE